MVGRGLRKGDEEMIDQIHPCKCTSYNGDQCYNCLNGAHSWCDGKKKCVKRNVKHPGLRIVEKK